MLRKAISSVRKRAPRSFKREDIRNAFLDLLADKLDWPIFHKKVFMRGDIMVELVQDIKSGDHLASASTSDPTQIPRDQEENGGSSCNLDYITVQKYIVPLNPFFRPQLEELRFLQKFSFEQYLTVKNFIQELKDAKALEKCSKQNKVDPFLRGAFGMEEIGTETSHLPSFLEVSNADDIRRELLFQFRDRYNQLITLVETCPVDSEKLEDEYGLKRAIKRAGEMCIYDCYPALPENLSEPAR
ncbi:hypothetical protein TWF506_009854 [Arthrobotrys conoides]|uniref:Uncharacterized protein n=1 Tax=Arthrobotrys conoides TaxID=74498 RepID=A0AAN8NAA9_9PEZI